MSPPSELQFPRTLVTACAAQLIVMRSPDRSVHVTSMSNGKVSNWFPGLGFAKTWPTSSSPFERISGVPPHGHADVLPAAGRNEVIRTRTPSCPGTLPAQGRTSAEPTPNCSPNDTCGVHLAVHVVPGMKSTAWADCATTLGATQARAPAAAERLISVRRSIVEVALVLDTVPPLCLRRSNRSMKCARIQVVLRIAYASPRVDGDPQGAEQRASRPWRASSPLR